MDGCLDDCPASFSFLHRGPVWQSSGKAVQSMRERLCSVMARRTPHRDETECSIHPPHVRRSLCRRETQRFLLYSLLSPAAASSPAFRKRSASMIEVHSNRHALACDLLSIGSVQVQLTLFIGLPMTETAQNNEGKQNVLRTGKRRWWQITYGTSLLIKKKK